MLDCQLENEGNPDARRNRERMRIKGFREHMEIQRVKQLDKQGPDSWFVRKFAVGIVAAVFAYSYYVYVVRLCIPMVRMDDSRLGARAQGLAYLVIYHFLFVMFVWSYVVAVYTQPGYARDFVPKTGPPQAEERYIDVVAGQPFEQQQSEDRTFHHARRGRRESVEGDSAAGMDERESVQEGTETDTIEMRERRRRSLAPSAADEEDRLAQEDGGTAALGPDIASAILQGTRPPSLNAAVPPLDQDERDRCQSTASTTLGPSSDRSALASPPKAHLRARTPTRPESSPDGALPRPSRSSGAPSYLAFPEPPDDYEPPKRLPVERIPRNAPVLTEQYRYDAREGLVRPYRSHRCRHCAAVVLKMDHHCPWVGTCVGAHNYKYFYNFLQYSSTYTLFVWLTLVIAQTLPLGTFSPSTGRPYPGVDGQQVAIIALAFLFWLFTFALFAAHTRLVLRNMTTIEEIGMNRTKQRERAALNQHYGFWQFRAKRANRREWDKQWGNIATEGNLWWLGSKRANWEMVMGMHKLGWFLPISAKPRGDDGLSYVPNPRFSDKGEWRMRREWPKELQ
ncbi:uncharacterized protein RHOBADRAFT_53460 [Rhodotorula graminis WP1]|uniref:Palmitoyltransferase n=1 Tax=Rhodotorula graminis (strain WP1) TaxID=578459 RepID=A0A194S429_RHOGW|nr:uncharacterized protein RHOBADRAFT_53460 [Rhodotorula graminis WP1]KPV75488.1 hypothetical protein RHOBADRAFT_53460 [Rhodotorula graminis WP1]